MDSSPNRIVQRAIVGGYLRALRKAWLHGYDGAYERWKSLTPAEKQLVADVLAGWLAYTGHQRSVDSISPEAQQVQLLNVASRRRANPTYPLKWIVELGPLPAPVAKRSGLFTLFANEQSRPRLGPQWEDVGIGFGALNWSLIADSWRTMTAGFRGIVRVVSDSFGDPMPDSMDQAASLAWLDRFAPRPVPTNEEQLRALGELRREDQRELASTLLDQYAAWLEKEFVDKGHCGHTIDSVIPIPLANLACFCAPLDADLLRKAWNLKLHYHVGIFRMDEAEPEARLVVGTSFPPGHEEWVEICKSPHLASGVSLTEKDADASLESAVRAGHGELVYLNGHHEPLLVLLDVDLTSPDAQFLGVAGTRLRICDAGAQGGEPLFTKIDTHGGVKLMSEGMRLPELDEYFRGEQAPLVAGRPLLSRFEGLREAGYLGTSVRVGGLPAWEQYPEVPASPVSGSPMTFIAQFPHPLGGTAYAFLDYVNLVACVITQYD